MGKPGRSSSTMNCFFSCFTSPKTITNDDDAQHDAHHHKISSINPPPPPQQQQHLDTTSENSSCSSIKCFSWDEIQQYTGNFSQVIGVGGFSTVYLAQLPASSSYSSSSMAAVKIYNYSSERLNRVFRNELDICTQLQHSNIVKLIGYCDERDEGVLVFDYIQSGNLQDILHTNKTTTFLPWKTRMSIAYQLAQSLHHLHEQCSPHIVHGDIKSANLLLTSSTPPQLKLCDFGSSKLGLPPTTRNSTSSSTSSSSSSSSSSTSSSTSRTAMLGSPGYVDPHYLMTGIISKKSDIYSLGVIILELITGLEAYSSDREQLLTSLVRNKTARGGDYESFTTVGSFDVEKVVTQMVDPLLLTSDSIVDEQQVRAMVCVAGMCLHPMPSLRPTAEEICKVMTQKNIV